MATKNNAKQPNKYKPLLMVVAFLVTLYFLFVGIVAASNWYKIRPYKTLANEVNTTLGGGYKISYTWNCGLETSSCPSVRMLKDVNFNNYEEANTKFFTFKDKLSNAGFEGVEVTYCGTVRNLNVYCTMEAKKDGKRIEFNAKSDFIGIDIQ